MKNSLDKNELNRYSRHLLLPEIGIEGQQKLKNSSALVVGAGGLGSPVLLYLASAGVGKIGIADFDLVEESNLQRQIIHKTSSVGKEKSESAKDRLIELNPLIEIETFRQKITRNNALEIISNFDLVIDGSDNFPTRYLLNDCCVFLKKPMIYASIYRFEGQVSVFDSRNGPCYRCLFPEPPKNTEALNCSEVGVLGILPGIIGSFQANEAVKLILGIGQPLVGKLLLLDALKMSFDEIRFPKNPDCPVCGTNPTITEPIDYDTFCGISQINDFEISPEEFLKKIKSEKLLLIDVREPHEIEIQKIENSLSIPLNQLKNRIPELKTEKEIIVYCQSGTRSKKAVEILKSSAIHNVKSLKGGINAFKTQTLIS